MYWVIVMRLMIESVPPSTWSPPIQHTSAMLVMSSVAVSIELYIEVNCMRTFASRLWRAELENCWISCCSRPKACTMRTELSPSWARLNTELSRSEMWVA